MTFTRQPRSSASRLSQRPQIGYQRDDGLSRTVTDCLQVPRGAFYGSLNRRQRCHCPDRRNDFDSGHVSRTARGCAGYRQEHQRARLHRGRGYWYQRSARDQHDCDRNALLNPWFVHSQVPHHTFQLTGHVVNVSVIDASSTVVQARNCQVESSSPRSVMMKNSPLLCSVQCQMSPRKVSSAQTPSSKCKTAVPAMRP